MNNFITAKAATGKNKNKIKEQKDDKHLQKVSVKS